VKLYVEGGGDSSALRTACRAGFSKFLNKAGFQGKMPRIVACGSRQNAYDSFCTAIRSGEDALLLVDSESTVVADDQQGEPENWRPWNHLGNRTSDQWERPANAAEEDCHLMVQCMEAWFLADSENLQNFFGQGFNPASLPHESPIESLPKKRIFQILSKTTEHCKTKAKYGKGEHSFRLLAHISSDRVTAASPWAKRFIGALQKKINAH
jgi:hypothetical protein